jgi:hypothetical protein
MRPGVDASTVETSIGGGAPVSVLVWFGWCNGIAGRPGQIQDDANIIPGYNPLSIEEAVGIIGEYEGDAILGKNWIPLLGSAGGDIYAAIWTPGRDAQVAGVLIGEPTEIEFSSIEQMVAVFNGCYLDGAFFVDDRGTLAMRPERYDSVYGAITGNA